MIFFDIYYEITIIYAEFKRNFKIDEPVFGAVALRPAAEVALRTH